jgi:ribose transport system permease protein
VSTETEAQPAPVARQAQRSERTGVALELLERFGLVLLLVAVVVFFCFYGPTADVYRTWLNFRTIVSNEAALSVLALASILPLIGGSFDLSVASIMLLANVAAAAAMSYHGAPVVLAVLLALALGAGIGLLNGLVVAKAGVNALIATLGTASVITGVVQWYTGGLSIVTGIPDSLTRITTERWLGVPRIAVFTVVVAALIWYVLAQTPYGRYLEAVGSNPPAARLVGIEVDRIVVVSFVLSGTFAAVAGLLQLAHDGSAHPQIGLSFLLPALAAAFLGATTIQPGRFNVLGTLVAVYFIAAAVQGMNYAGVQSWVQDVFNGTALVAAVALLALIGRRREQSTGPGRRA